MDAVSSAAVAFFESTAIWRPEHPGGFYSRYYCTMPILMMRQLAVSASLTLTRDL